jgi:hypothetical protein
MAATIAYQDKVMLMDEAIASDDALWIKLEDFENLTGWQVKPAGVCKDDICVPISPGRESEFLRDDNSFNLAALSRLLGETAVHSDDMSVWVFSEPASKIRGRHQSLGAPDFALPDLDGRLHHLSDYRGNKVLLFAWASW